MPRSHSTTWSLPAASRYSAASSNSSIFADRPRFSSTGLPALADRAEQGEILHVAGADLQRVGMFGDEVDIGGVHHLGDDRQVEFVADLAQDLQPLRAVAGKAVGAGARLVGAGPEALRAGRLHRHRRSCAVCSRLSTAQGPAITAKPRPPIASLPKFDEVSCGWRSRLTSL